MRKEIVWASIIGIAFGLIIAFGVWRINSSVKPKSAQTEATPTPAGNFEFKITLNKPENEDVVTTDVTTVSGITKSLTWLTILGEEEDYIIQADEKGVFSQDVNLIAGVNRIKIVAYDSTGAQSVEKVLVVYSSSFEEKTVSTPDPNEATTTESAIRQKVQEKVQDVLNKPKAYIGVVTDIAESTIQIKSEAGEIKQISTSKDDIAVVNARGTTNKTVKLTDIAIGDFIVAMGYRNGNSVLNAQRILITQPLTEPKNNAFYGKVTQTTTKDMTVGTLKDGKESSVTPTTKTGIFSYANGQAAKIKLTAVEEGDTVIYVTSEESGKFSIRTIFVLKT